MNVRTRIVAAAGLVLALALGACSAGGGSGGSGESKDAGPYRVALSMSYSGNDWQGEATNLIKVAAEKAPLKDKVKEVKVFVAGTEAQKQISQIQQMIAQKFDIIVIYPISTTALNGVIKQGCDAGITMMTYDSQVTEPCAHNVTFDQADAGKKTAEALAGFMNDKGNVVMITGVAGTYADEQRTKAAEAVFKERGIKILGKCAGDWAQGPSGQCMSQFLASFDNIDGVWAQAGGPAVLQALDAKGKKYIPIAGESENQWRLALADPEMKAKGLQGVSYGAPPYQGAAALRLAVDSRSSGKKLDSTIDVGYDFFTQDQIKTCEDGTAEELAQGCNAFTSKEVSSGFFADWYSDEWTKGISLSEVISGKPTT